METGGNRLFKVKDSKGKSEYFDLKGAAKKHRDALIAGGFKGACVSPGPDHPRHHTNRKKAGWNTGRHPKKGKVGKQARLFLKK